jgi:hypothetical protein
MVVDNLTTQPKQNRQAMLASSLSLSLVYEQYARQDRLCKHHLSGQEKYFLLWFAAQFVEDFENPPGSVVSLFSLDYDRPVGNRELQKVPEQWIKINQLPVSVARVAAWVQVKFCNFYLENNRKIANNKTTTETFRAIKFYLIKSTTECYRQLGEISPIVRL